MDQTTHYQFGLDGTLYAIPVEKVTDKKVKLRFREPEGKQRKIIGREEAVFSVEEAVEQEYEFLEERIDALRKELRTRKKALEDIETGAHRTVNVTADLWS